MSYQRRIFTRDLPYRIQSLGKLILLSALVLLSICPEGSQSSEEQLHGLSSDSLNHKFVASPLKIKRWSKPQEVSGWNILNSTDSFEQRNQQKNEDQNAPIGSGLPTIKIYSKKYSQIKRVRTSAKPHHNQHKQQQQKHKELVQDPEPTVAAQQHQQQENPQNPQNVGQQSEQVNSFTIGDSDYWNNLQQQQLQQQQDYYTYQFPQVEENGREYIQGPGQSVDPEHPIYQAYQTYNRFNHEDTSITQKPIKKVQQVERDDIMMPLDKGVIVVGMIFAWAFWIIIVAWYYSMGQQVPHGVHNAEVFPAKSSFFKKFILNIPMGGRPHWSVGRALDTTNSWNWTAVIELIDLAQETYEKFDFQSLDCQKKALCDLAQKQNDFGETGRKISSSMTYVTNVSKRYMDLLDGLPIPTIIKTYLREYSSAINQGKISTKDCSIYYPKCQFAIKETFVKVQKKLNQL